ncbi:sodium:proton antiporter [Caulobacter sp. Root1455]|uniref:cation:proton antiporter n=1 Tax=unclassified Caulobacter TaxID=2648921 RepID=UPI0006FCF8FC|nr:MULTISPECIES: sodium:proton antiporter [unclassified Caulobacter]KQY35802.1 sodium:proton antiporter [Caulobacter sp. Root487D2Y]KQZ06232.1 sodium:proton antiporter [Caulobacter sp. Root1455]
MLVFEWILVLLIGAVLLSALARRVGAPYPALLAMGGAAVALIPGAPRLALEPELILALFIAPVLLDAAYDSSLRDLKDNWRPVSSLVLVAVSLTTLGVAWVARLLFPEMPWPAAIALGAIVAPPDAVAALAVLRQVQPPHRILKILEGESLLNDASALLIYRLAVGAVGGGFSLAHAVPTFVLVAVGSVVAGYGLARLSGLVFHKVTDMPSSVIVQFVSTFGVWILAERLGLSGVVTIVVYGVTVAWRPGAQLSARLRVPSFAVWETVTVVLNVLAFTLIGLQIRPILETLSPHERMDYLRAALVILATVIAVRIAWVMTYNTGVRLKNHWFGLHVARSSMAAPTTRGGLMVSWCGMRGMVTLAAALALPEGFPYRDFILLAAFAVVLGTLVVQGLTLKPLMLLLRLPDDDPVRKELKLARAMALKAALAELDGDQSEAAEALRREYGAALHQTKTGADARASTENALRRRVVAVSREAIADLRKKGEIGDDAYRALEEEFDWLELSARE